MFKKTFLTASCLASFCFADNFLIGSAQGDISRGDAHSSEAAEHAPAQQERLPQRVVIEDVNPSSELGQLIGVMLKNEQKKAAMLAAPKPKPKPKPKPIVKKKAPKKKVVKKKPVAKKPVAHKDPHIEVKSEEASKVNESEKKEAEHNENNSSLKKISSSNACD